MTTESLARTRLREFWCNVVITYNFNSLVVASSFILFLIPTLCLFWRLVIICIQRGRETFVNAYMYTIIWRNVNTERERNILERIHVYDHLKKFVRRWSPFFIFFWQKYSSFFPAKKYRTQKFFGPKKYRTLRWSHFLRPVFKCRSIQKICVFVNIFSSKK